MFHFQPLLNMFYLKAFVHTKGYHNEMIEERSSPIGERSIL